MENGNNFGRVLFNLFLKNFTLTLLLLFSGRRRTQHLAHALKLPERYQESAMRYYNLALNNNFTKGRRTEVVAAVCLYVVCRQEKSSQMLIDFSDLLQVSV
jgi:transcription factor IIIB subunit 2